MHVGNFCVPIYVHSAFFRQNFAHTGLKFPTMLSLPHAEVNMCTNKLYPILVLIFLILRIRVFCLHVCMSGYCVHSVLENARKKWQISQDWRYRQHSKPPHGIKSRSSARTITSTEPSLQLPTLVLNPTCPNRMVTQGLLGDPFHRQKNCSPSTSKS